MIRGIGNPPEPPAPKPRADPRERGRARVRRALVALRSHRSRKDRLLREMEILQARIEVDDYPAYRPEDFRNDDWTALDAARSALRAMEGREPDLLQDLRVAFTIRNR